MILPIGFIYSVGKKLLNSIDSYTYSIAYNINVFSTFVCADLYNDTLVKKTNNKYLFGYKNFSISYHLGRNLMLGSLSKVGILLNRLLDFIENNHTIKAVQKEDVK